jgi:hypothetical protein
MTVVPVPDSYEQRVRCCVHCAIEAEELGETVVLAECVHALEALVPQVVPDSS